MKLKFEDYVIKNIYKFGTFINFIRIYTNIYMAIFIAANRSWRNHDRMPTIRSYIRSRVPAGREGGGIVGRFFCVFKNHYLLPRYILLTKKILIITSI